MFRNHILIALRKFRRNKLLTAINIFGLATGMATALVIVFFILHEISYDRFHKNAAQIVRVIFRGTVQGGKMNEAGVMAPVAKTLKKDFPEVLDATRIRASGRVRFLTGIRTFAEADLAYVDSNFFQVFTFPFLEGIPGKALQEPQSIVISESIAKKYYGRTNPVGRLLNLKDGTTPFVITGVMKEMPGTSDFHFDMLGSMSAIPESRENTWMGGTYYTYLLLQKGFDYRRLESRLPQVVEKYLGPQLQQGMGVSFEEFRRKGNDIGLYLQPLRDIHLHADQTGDISDHGNLQQLYIFSAIAAFMLAIACINFMNLSTAGASRRAREVGIRKVLGSLRQELVRQFLLESVLLASFSVVLAVVIVAFVLPFFNQLTGQSLRLDFIGNPWLIPGLIAFAVGVGLLAGSYPAAFLSGFKPVKVLKGRFQSSPWNARVRSGLVVFQFFISIALLIATVVVYRQLSFMDNIDLGYKKDQVLLLPETFWLKNNARAFRDQLSRDPRILNVSVSNYLPAGNSYSNNFFVYPDEHSNALTKTIRYEVDEHYVPTLGMQVVAGRNFSPDMKTDSTAIILNETAAREFGWGRSAIGHTLTRTEDRSVKTYHVIGVLKDFNFRSLHQSITPLVMTLGDGTGTHLLQVKSHAVGGLLADLRREWTSLTTELPFDYIFLDERFRRAYEAEQKTGLMLGIFAGLTIFVACLGLFGLAMFTAEQRTREIGIRKVLGASVTGVARLLSKDFLRLVIIANAIAWPLAWLAMHRWLQDFAYRTEFSWWIFVVVGIAAIGIALFTVSFQAIRAAMANPVKSLRAE